MSNGHISTRYTTQHTVLVVDDEPDNLEVMRLNFRRQFSIKTAGSGHEALEMMAEIGPCVLVTDQRMPGMTGLELAQKALESWPDTVPIILTAYQDVDVLMQAVGLVHRFVVKPWKREELASILMQALELLHLRLENRRLSDRLRRYTGYLEEQLRQARNYGTMVCESHAMKEVDELIHRASKGTFPVYIHGETGTGKELVAYEIHARSGGQGRPFIRVSCEGRDSERLSRELLGSDGSMGILEMARGGTLVLDRITVLDAEAQEWLAHVMEHTASEVRFLALGLEAPDMAVRHGLLASSLSYVLAPMSIRVPPLRERRDDLYALVKVLLERISSEIGKSVSAMEGEAMARLMSHSWPGNVRELEAVLRRGALLSQGGTLRLKDLQIQEPSSPGGGMDLEHYLAEEEKRFIMQAMDRAQGNVSSAARLLGLSRPTLYYKLRKYGIRVNEQ